MKVTRFIHDNRYKIFKTLVTYFSYICVGSAITLIGSSLLDLQIREGIDFATVSRLIPCRSAGHIVGSAFAGIADRYFKHTLILCVANLASGIFVAITPNLNQFYYAATSIFLAGVAQGCIDVMCNTLLAIIWKDKCANWLQVLHMSFGVGALITPIFCRPFLLPSTEEDTEILSSNVTTIEPRVVPIYTPDDVMIQYAFLIVAIFTIIIAIPYGCIYLIERKASTVHNQQNDLKTTEEEVKQLYSPLKVYSAVFIVAGISHIIFSIETLIGSLGPSFAVKSDLHMDKKTGVLLTTVFWACFSFYRLIYIPMTFIISETKLLLSSLTISLIGFLVTIPWANYYTSCIWTGFTLIGIGISPIFSAAYGMLAKHIIVTSRISSMIFIPGVLGESIHPGIAATFLDKNPIICLYYIGVAGGLFIVLYLILLVYCKKVFKTTINLQHKQLAERSSIRSISRY